MKKTAADFAALGIRKKTTTVKPDVTRGPILGHATVDPPASSHFKPWKKKGTPYDQIGDTMTITLLQQNLTELPPNCYIMFQDKDGNLHRIEAVDQADPLVFVLKSSE